MSFYFFIKIVGQLIYLSLPWLPQKMEPWLRGQLSSWGSGGVMLPRALTTSALRVEVWLERSPRSWSLREDASALVVRNSGLWLGH